MHSLTIGSHLLDDGSNEDTEHVETQEGTHGLKPEASATTAKKGLPRQSPFEVACGRNDHTCHVMPCCSTSTSSHQSWRRMPMPGTTKSAARRMLGSRFEGFSDRFRSKN